MSVTSQTGVVGSGEGWWFIGAEIVQALKGAVGVRRLSAEGRFDDGRRLWEWVGELGYGWRREFQVEGLAGALAREVGVGMGARVEAGRVAKVAGIMAGGGAVEGFSELEVGVAREINAVACLGLAVGACVKEVRTRLEVVCERAAEIVGGVEGVWVEEVQGEAMVMGLECADWPEAELAKMLFRVVGEAAVAMGRDGGPAFWGEG